MNKALIIGIILVVLVGGGWFILSSQKTSAPVANLGVTENKDAALEATDTVPAPDTSNVASQSSPEAVMVKGETKTFTIESSNFKFSLPVMKVKKGDTVVVKLTNKEGFHDFTLDEFSVKTAQLAAGKSEDVTFVAGKTGTFEYYCSVGSHRAMGMKGNLIVE